MSFRLWTIFYVFALVASAMATFGAGGLFVALAPLGFWAWQFYPRVRNSLVTTLVYFGIGIVAVALLLPFISNARSAYLRNQCLSHQKQLATAIHLYLRDHGHFPPAFIADANGKPMHSWRVLVLPYVAGGEFYQEYDFNEPWDGPNNSKLEARMPEIFRCPASCPTITTPTETHYFAVVGPDTIWPGESTVSPAQVTDGLSDTILLIEASGRGTHWMEPRDVTMSEAIGLLADQPRPGHMHVRYSCFWTTYEERLGRHVAMSDRNMIFALPFSRSGLARAMLTIAGGETLSADWPKTNDGQFAVQLRSYTVVHWRLVYAATVFVALSLAPLGRLVTLRRRERANSRRIGLAGGREVGVAADANA